MTEPQKKGPRAWTKWEQPSPPLKGREQKGHHNREAGKGGSIEGELEAKRIGNGRRGNGLLLGPNLKRIVWE